VILKDEELLARFRRIRRCEWCREKIPASDPHHIHSKGAGRVDIPGNLVALCRTCHNRNHAGHRPNRAQLLAVAGQREELTPVEIAQAVHDIRAWPKEKPLPPELAKYRLGGPGAPPRPLHFDLWVEIAGVRYGVEVLKPDKKVRTAAVRLVKGERERDGERRKYDIARHRRGYVTCDCPDAVKDKNGTYDLCKHAQAVVNIGLV
jgi:HNH endonuclease